MTEQVGSGFSFCGRHCGDFGVWYTPGDARLNTRIPAFDIETVEIPGRHGGYYFGNKVKPRVFTLPCFFEDEPEAAWPAIQHWLSRDRFGE